MPGLRHTRPRVAWLQLLLVGALACVVLILAEAYRAARSSRAVAEHALRDYAGFAAWSFRQHLERKGGAAVNELLGAVNHGDGLHVSPEIPNARDLGRYLEPDAECRCRRPRHGPLPLHFFGFTLGSDTLAVGTNLAPPRARGWVVDDGEGRSRKVSVTALPRDDAAWINSALTAAARRTPASEWGYDVIVMRRDSVTRFLAARSMPTVRGDTIVYAFEYSEQALDSLLETILNSSDLLPGVLLAGRHPRDVMDVEVSDMAGNALFATAADRRWDLDATVQLPVSYGGMRVRARLRPEMAGMLLIGGLPSSRVPLLLFALVLTVGLTVLAAMQLRREARFAEVRSNFVANVSHELRTPLTQVRLVLDMLRLGRAGNASAREHALRVADREVLRLQHLVEGVLAFTRGMRSDESTRVSADIALEVRSVVEEFHPLAAARDVHVEVTGAAPLMAAMYPGALRQVLLNLLDNALKYGGDGSTVTVDLREEAGEVTLCVSDTGPGVPPGERARIWQPFERGRAAGQRAAGGSGIGLTIVREIVEAHGGTVAVDDASGGGARFVLTFPQAAG